MAPKQTTERRRPPGSLRLVRKTAKGKTYRRWQWRTHRRTDTGWRTDDVELGEKLWGIRTRTLIALGDLRAPLLVERYIRWQTNHWNRLPAWTGKPDGTHQRAAWWLELPRKPDGVVKLRFRSIDGSTDFRRLGKVKSDLEIEAANLYSALIDDPLIELARLLWQEQEAQQQADKRQEDLSDLKRQRRIGEITQRDYEADERMILLSLDDWENIISCSVRRYDDLLKEVIASISRPTREHQQTRILALVDRHLSDPKQRQRWHADQWDDHTLTWWPAA